MTHCLSDEALLECYMGEADANVPAHLKDCSACEQRYRTLQSDMAMIGKTLEMPPPRRRRSALYSFIGWRPAATALALTIAFMVGWSLRSSTLTPSREGVRIAASRESAPAAAPVQLSMAKMAGITPVAYADYVQSAFESDLCSQPDDLLEPGCL